MQKNKNNLIWIDLEMTGLNVEQDLILEIGIIITTAHLEIIAESPSLAIHQTDELLQRMDKWNTHHHTRSGLIEEVKNSTINEAQAEASMLEFVRQFVPPQTSPMCGSTICQDRRFLYRHMPNLESYFHYRNLDVTTLKILAQHWAPPVAAGLNKETEHRALQDIRDSINELRYYRDCFIKVEQQG